MICVALSEEPTGTHGMPPTLMALRLLGVINALPDSRIDHSDGLLASVTVAPVSRDVRLVSYVYVHGDAEHVADTPRTLSTTVPVVLLDVVAAAPVTQLTCDTLVE